MNPRTIESRRNSLGWRCALAVALAWVGGVLAADSTGIAAAELSPRSGPRGATMFTPMPEQVTGVVIENNYADPAMWSDRYQELAYGEMGTGVAIGDFDGDGRPDIFVVSKTEQSRLFRNLGDWKFEDVTEKAGLKLPPRNASEPRAWSQGATFVDVNNDGRLDLYVCRLGAPNLLYINQGDGTFREEAAPRGLAVVDASGMAAFCDYDRDGWLDVYIHTNMLDAAAHPKGQRDYLFHNNGDGTFTNVTDRAGISGETAAHSATWWDYDNDGWPDLYVANDYAEPDALYHNNRDGTFTNVINDIVPHMPYYGMGSDLGDVNNDGLIDLLVADMAPTTHEKDHRGMAGSRARAQLYPSDPHLAPQYMRNALYLNTGVGRCLEAAEITGLAATDWTWSVRWEDLDNDGRLDLFATNGMIREFHNADLLDRIMAAESPAESKRLVRASPRLTESNLAFRNLGDLRFENVSAAWGLNQKAVSFGAAFGDLDGDGDLDVVYANYEGNVTVLRNDSETGHRLIVGLRGVRSNRFGVGATVRIETAHGPQVRQLVLARGYLSSSEPILHFGLGDDTQIRRLTVTWPSGAVQTFENLAADRKYTVTESSPQVASAEFPLKPRPTQFKEVGASVNFSWVPPEVPARTSKVQALLPMDLDRVGPFMVAGDIDGNGTGAVVVSGGADSPVRIFRPGADGKFKSTELPAASADAGPANGPLLLIDANGDGKNDLLVTTAGTLFPAASPKYRPQLFLNDGHGSFQPAADDALPRIESSVGAVASADFNHDGAPDLFIGARVLPGRYPLAPQSALLVNRGGKFEDVTAALAPGLERVGMVTSALWSDVDGDGWPDLIVTLEWGGVRYWHNRQGAGFDDWSERAGFAAAGAGWWSAIATADFNGDGRPDYVVGNLGLNTPYRASPEQPALLFYGEFAGRGHFQLVEAYEENGKIFPRRSRAELAAEIPSISKRFPRNDVFARATVGEIVGEDRLTAARRFAATEFRSGVFLSGPDGRFTFRPLPNVAQLSPIQAIAVGDFDGDGHADICVVQNSDAPVAAIGRFDGGLGLWLRGDGRGNFTPVPPADSGFVVPGDSRGIVAFQVDASGRPGLLVVRNRLPALAFRPK